MKHNAYLSLALITLASAGCSGAAGEFATDETIEETAQAQEALTDTERRARIQTKYNQNTWLGATLGGYVSHAAGGHQVYEGYRSIFVGDSVNAAFILLGDIAGKYYALGSQNSPAGYPLSDEFASAGGVAQNFTGGWMLWKPALGASLVYGCNTWGHAGASYQAGALGFSTGDEAAWNGKRRQTFEYGRIYTTPGSTSDCKRDARVVYTAAHPNPANYGPIVSAYGNWYSQDRSNIRASGSGFTPNSTVSFYLNYPDGQMLLERRQADANGVVAQFHSTPLYHHQIPKVNGFVSVLAYDSGGRWVTARGSSHGQAGRNVTVY